MEIRQEAAETRPIKMEEETEVGKITEGRYERTPVSSGRVTLRDVGNVPRQTPAQIDQEVLQAYEREKERIQKLKEQEMARAASRDKDEPEETISSMRPVRQEEVIPKISEKKESLKEENKPESENDMPVFAAPPVRKREQNLEQMKIDTPEESLRIKPRVIGVYQNAYILVEAEGKLIMIDQHAAHERILFEKFQKEISNGAAMQTLLMPEVFPATSREVAIVADNRDALLAAGYDAEPLGERAVQVRAVPYILGKTVMKPLFLEMIDQLDRLKDATTERRHEVIITASCKHAIKAGEALSEAEIEELVNIMATTDAPPVCAHGRPVLKVWTLNDVEKMFKRT